MWSSETKCFLFVFWLHIFRCLMVPPPLQRDEFWETQSAFGGAPEIWVALRTAIENPELRAVILEVSLCPPLRGRGLQLGASNLINFIMFFFCVPPEIGGVVIAVDVCSPRRHPLRCYHIFFHNDGPVFQGTIEFCLQCWMASLVSTREAYCWKWPTPLD